jgi:hypothetical protein
MLAETWHERNTLVRKRGGNAAKLFVTTCAIYSKRCFIKWSLTTIQENTVKGKSMEAARVKDARAKDARAKDALAKARVI